MYKFSKEDNRHIHSECRLGADVNLIPDCDVNAALEDYNFLHNESLKDYLYWKAKVSALQNSVRELKGVLTIIWDMKSLKGERELLFAKLYCERDFLRKCNEQLVLTRKNMKYYNHIFSKLQERKIEAKMKDVGQYHYKFSIFNSHGTVIDSLEFNCERDLTKEEAIEILGKVDIERYKFFHLYFTTCAKNIAFGVWEKSKSKPGDEKFPTYA